MRQGSLVRLDAGPGSVAGPQVLSPLSFWDARVGASVAGTVGLLQGCRELALCPLALKYLDIFTTGTTLRVHLGSGALRTCLKKAECHICAGDGRELESGAPHQASSLVDSQGAVAF